MPRDSNIPLFLWIATAILAHMIWGGGADQVSKLIEERLDIRRFAVAVQQHLRGKGTELEIAIVDDAADPAPPPEDPAEAAQPDALKRKEPPESKQAQPEPPKPKILPPEVALKKRDKKAEEPPKELPKLEQQNRIAVRQNVENKQQEDNPNAEFIADEANKVKEQTQARITSNDQNDKDPTPAGNHASAEKAPGDSEQTRIAQSEDRPGEANRAPTPASSPNAPADEAQAANANPTGGARAQETPSPKPAPAAGAAAPPTPDPERALAERKALEGLRPQEPQPEAVTAQNGSFDVSPTQPGAPGQSAQKPRKKRLPPAKRPGNLLGLGAAGLTPGGVNLNLSPQMAFAAVGQDRLRKERQADAERRKSAHRGSWKTLGIERWRSAIENYVASVKPGNQTALNTARSPFGSYLNIIHGRLHPIFADSFLASLGHLPGDHPMNRPDISTNLEIVLDREEGKIVRMGVTKTSGVTAFDIAALESVQRAQPFGTPPIEIVSPDGNVYFHWEFWRNELYACSTYFARPYILKAKPKTAPPSPRPAPAPYDPSEPPGRDQRHGQRSGDRALEKRAALR